MRPWSQVGRRCGPASLSHRRPWEPAGRPRLLRREVPCPSGRGSGEPDGHWSPLQSQLAWCLTLRDVLGLSGQVTALCPCPSLWPLLQCPLGLSPPSLPLSEGCRAPGPGLSHHLPRSTETAKGGSSSSPGDTEVARPRPGPTCPGSISV